jgi:hypothetical protein
VNEPQIEFLWWAGCPSWDRALEILRDRVSAAGIDPEAVVITEIESEEQARSLGFPGSPTIRINGEDVQNPGQNPIGLSCRVYRRRDGRTSPLPDAADIDAALVSVSS